MKLENMDIDKTMGNVSEVLDERQKAKGVLIHALQEIQKEHNFLPEDELKSLSKHLSIPLSEIYSTATFYKQFYFVPRGKNIACVCTGTACHVRGAGEILDNFKQEFSIGVGETSEDKSLTLETVGCVGCCGLAPVVTVNGEVYGDVSTKTMGKIIDEFEGK